MVLWTNRIKFNRFHVKQRKHPTSLENCAIAYPRATCLIYAKHRASSSWARDNLLILTQLEHPIHGTTSVSRHLTSPLVGRPQVWTHGHLSNNSNNSKITISDYIVPVKSIAQIDTGVCVCVHVRKCVLVDTNYNAIKHHRKCETNGLVFQWSSASVLLMLVHNKYSHHPVNIFASFLFACVMWNTYCSKRSHTWFGMLNVGMTVGKFVP